MTSKKSPKVTCLDIEVAIALRNTPRKNIIVPNVSWGMGLHECDLLIVTPAGVATEVEIKVSLADCKKDAKKRHTHDSKRIKHLYFAVPEAIFEKCLPFIPERAGIYVCEPILFDEGLPTQFMHLIIREVRRPQPTQGFQKFTDKEILKLTRLGLLRLWPLKGKVKTMKREIAALKAASK